MIRQIRRLVVVLFAISLIFGIGTGFYYYQNTDVTAPVINMKKDSIEISIKDEENAILKGVTAEDDVDGDVTESLTVESISNFIADNTREATIAAFDEAGNVTKVSRTVTYSDYKSPKLSLKGTLYASTSNYTDIMNLIKVKDCIDGNISGQVQVTSDDNSYLSTAGDHKMHIQVTNSAGDSLNIPVTVTTYLSQNDMEQAEIKLGKYCVYVKKGAEIDPLSYLEELDFSGKTYLWSADDKAFIDTETTVGTTGATYYDHIYEKDLTITNLVNTKKAGTYEITYRYKNDTVSGLARLVVIVGGGAK